jgi:hypothetical protein
MPPHSVRRKNPVLRLIFNPFKCADCGTRFWRVKGNLLTAVLLVAAIFAVIAATAFVLDFSSTSTEEQFKFAE